MELRVILVNDPDFTLHVGDVRDVLRELPAESVHCVVTSPPYWGLRDYGTGSWEGGNPECDHAVRRDARVESSTLGGGKATTGHQQEGFKDECPRCGARRADKQLGLEATPEEYVANMVGVFREVRRVLRRDGTCWLNLGDSYVSGQGGRQSSVGELPPVIRRDRPEPKKRPELENAPSGWAERAVTPRTYPGRESGLKPKDLYGLPWRVAFALQQPWYAGTIRDERDRIWLAAMVEAEGCLFIHKRKAGSDSGAKFTKADGTEMRYDRTKDTYGSGLEVSSTDRVIVERCMEIAGCGSICEQGPAENARRKQTLYRWNLRTNECRDLMRELYPHLLAKKHEARLLIGCPSSGEDARKAHESLKALHQGQTACIDFREPEGMWERGWYLRSEIIWSKKPNPMPESVRDRPTKAHEQVFLLTKEPTYFYDADAIREPHAELDRRTLRGLSRVDYNGKGGDESRNDLDADWKGQHPSGRNKRSVWEIATEAYPDAHFATFPQALVAPCVKAGTSERGCCPECGAPWARELDVAYTNPGNRRTNGPRSVEARDDPMRGTINSRGSRLERQTTTLGWSPSCDHALVPVPATILDPFVGSGTAALVARKHGRKSIGIELNPEYAQLAAQRLSQLSLLAEGAA